MPLPRVSRGAAFTRLAALGLAACALRTVCFAGGRGAGASLRGGQAVARAEALNAAGTRFETDEDVERGALAAAVVTGSGVLILSGCSLVLGLAAAALGYGAVLLPGRRRAGPPSTSAGFDPSNEVGAIMPLGYWDPAGLMKKPAEGDMYGWEWRDEATFKQYRSAELKHGRLAMVALTGMISAAFVRFPGSEFQGAEGWAAVNTYLFPEVEAGIGAIVLLAGIVELKKGDGDFEDPLEVGKLVDKEWGDLNELRNKELAHGRLAMSAVLVLWLYEYNLGLPPSYFLREPSPAALIGIFVMVLYWSRGYWDESKVAYAASAGLAGAYLLQR